MALKLIEDFAEVGANPENVSGSGWNATGGRVADSGAMKSTSTGVWQALSDQGWTAAVTDFYCGFALCAQGRLNTAIISVYGDGNATQHLTLTMNASNYLEVRLGNESGSVLGTSSAPFPVTSQWRSVNCYFNIHDSTGTALVKVDGTTVINFTGDTKNGGTNTTIDAFRMALPSGANNGIADLVVNDGTGSINNSYPGDIAVIRCIPNGNGTYSQFTGSDGNSTDNYLLVDEVPSNTSDFVYAASAGLKDSYTVADLPLAATSVLGVRAVARCAKSGAGTAGMSVFVVENSTETFGPDVPLSTSYAWQGDTIRETAPSTAVAWTISDVNSMEIGVRSESS